MNYICAYSISDILFFLLMCTVYLETEVYFVIHLRPNLAEKLNMKYLLIISVRAHKCCIKKKKTLGNALADNCLSTIVLCGNNMQNVKGLRDVT